MLFLLFFLLLTDFVQQCYMVSFIVMYLLMHQHLNLDVIRCCCNLFDRRSHLPNSWIIIDYVINFFVCRRIVRSEKPDFLETSRDGECLVESHLELSYNAVAIVVSTSHIDFLERISRLILFVLQLFH